MEKNLHSADPLLIKDLKEMRRSFYLIRFGF